MDDFEDENDEDTEKFKEPTEKDATTEEDDSDLESTPETENAAKASPEALFLPVKDAKPSTKEQRELGLSCWRGWRCLGTSQRSKSWRG